MRHVIPLNEDYINRYSTMSIYGKTTEFIRNSNEIEISLSYDETKIFIQCKIVELGEILKNIAKSMIIDLEKYKFNQEVIIDGHIAEISRKSFVDAYVKEVSYQYGYVYKHINKMSFLDKNKKPLPNYSRNKDYTFNSKAGNIVEFWQYINNEHLETYILRALKNEIT